MNDFEEIIKNINPKDTIIAEVIDDGIKKTKNFLVVGKDEDYLYTIRITPMDQSQNSNYKKCNNKFRNKCLHYRWNTIFKIGKDEFLKKRGTVSEIIYNEIMRGMAKKSKSYDNIDFLSANFPLKEGSIILKDGNLYLVIKEEKDINKYKIAELKESTNNEAIIRIKGSKYSICLDETIMVDSTDNDFVVIFNFPSSIVKTIEKSDFGYYEFGDVISLKNSNKKVIYLTQINGIVYYVTFDQLELFTGICKINKDMVEGFYRKLSDFELNKIALKLEKALSKDIYHIYSDDAKDSILGAVKLVKKIVSI